MRDIYGACLTIAWITWAVVSVAVTHNRDSRKSSLKFNSIFKYLLVFSSLLAGFYIYDNSQTIYLFKNYFFSDLSDFPTWFILPSMINIIISIILIVIYIKSIISIEKSTGYILRSVYYILVLNLIRLWLSYTHILAYYKFSLYDISPIFISTILYTVIGVLIIEYYKKRDHLFTNEIDNKNGSLEIQD